MEKENNKIFLQICFFIVVVIASVLLFIYWFAYELKDIMKLVIIDVVFPTSLIYFVVRIWNNRFIIGNDERYRHKLSDDELIIKYEREKLLEFNEEKIPISKVIVPDKKIPIENIELELNEEYYHCPYYIQKRYLEILKVTKYGYNDITLRLNDYEMTDSRLKLVFQYSDYADHSVTNDAPDIKLEGDKTIRDLLEPGPLLYPLPVAKPSNHLGCSLLILTNDNKIIFPLRSKKVTFGKNTYAPSVSCAVNYNRVKGVDDTISLKNLIDEELNRELKEEFKIYNIVFLGLTRELQRLGKPEIYFIANTDMFSSEVLKILETRAEEVDEIEKYDCMTFQEMKDKPEELSQSLLTALTLYEISERL